MAFPTSPTDGQVYKHWYYDATVGAWRKFLPGDGNGLDADTIDGVHNGSVTPGNGTVSQAKLKTSIGSVSVYGISLASNDLPNTGTEILPGGQYGFYPQVKSSGTEYYRSTIAGIAGLKDNVDWYDGGCASTSYITTISMGTRNHSTTTNYAQQRYITSSGEIYWYFALRRKSDGVVLLQYQAPDHPSFGNGAYDEIIDTPFLGYNIKSGLYGEKYDEKGFYIEGSGIPVEIIVSNPLEEQRDEIKNRSKKDRKDPLEIIQSNFDLNDIVTPLWPDYKGNPSYYPHPITIGLIDDEFPFGGKAEVVKKVISKPNYVKIKKLSRKNLSQV